MSFNQFSLLAISLKVVVLVCNSQIKGRCLQMKPPIRHEDRVKEKDMNLWTLRK